MLIPSSVTRHGAGKYLGRWQGAPAASSPPSFLPPCQQGPGRRSSLRKQVRTALPCSFTISPLVIGLPSLLRTAAQMILPSHRKGPAMPPAALMSSRPAGLRQGSSTGCTGPPRSSLASAFLSSLTSLHTPWSPCSPALQPRWVRPKALATDCFSARNALLPWCPGKSPHVL